MNASKYIKKQDRLRAAIDRVNTQLSRFKDGLCSDVDNWDKFHDLKDRLQDKLAENYSEYQGKHFESFGWCSF